MLIILGGLNRLLHLIFQIGIQHVTSKILTLQNKPTCPLALPGLSRGHSMFAIFPALLKTQSNGVQGVHTGGKLSVIRFPLEERITVFMDHRFSIKKQLCF